MDERYNIYFAGQIKAGADLASVRAQVGKLFNANQATLDKLFSGTPQLIKRDCDRATAQKYQAAIDRAGGIPVIKRVESSAAASAPVPPPPAPKPLTAAERIAALAAAPDEVRFKQGPGAAAPANPAPAPASAPTSPVTDTSGIALAPPGTAVLRESERSAPVVRNVDTSHLAFEQAERLSAVPTPPPPAPDTSHLSMGAVGDSIPNLPSQAAPVAPDLSGLALSAPGTDFSDCAPPEPAPLNLDLSAMAALPPGTSTPEELDRQPLPVAVPSTDHISLQD